MWTDQSLVKKMLDYQQELNEPIYCNDNIKKNYFSKYPDVRSIKKCTKIKIKVKSNLNNPNDDMYQFLIPNYIFLLIHAEAKIIKSTFDSYKFKIGLYLSKVDKEVMDDLKKKCGVDDPQSQTMRFDLKRCGRGSSCCAKFPWVKPYDDICFSRFVVLMDDKKYPLNVAEYYATEMSGYILLKVKMLYNSKSSQLSLKGDPECGFLIPSNTLKVDVDFFDQPEPSTSKANFFQEFDDGEPKKKKKSRRDSSDSEQEEKQKKKRKRIVIQESSDSEEDLNPKKNKKEKKKESSDDEEKIIEKKTPHNKNIIQDSSDSEQEKNKIVQEDKKNFDSSDDEIVAKKKKVVKVESSDEEEKPEEQFEKTEVQITANDLKLN